MKRTEDSESLARGLWPWPWRVVPDTAFPSVLAEIDMRLAGRKETADGVAGVVP